MRSWKKTGVGVLVGLAGLLSACSLRLASQKPPRPQQSSFMAMGTRWNVSMIGIPDGKNFVALKDKLVSFALLYEMTFSSWTETSELRRLEMAGLDKTQSPSELFFEGLRLSQDAFSETGGLFDITVGAIEWKSLPSAVGLAVLDVDPDKKTFRFRKDPKRLTFDGIAKGMALGDMASFLVDEGVKEFTIDAGGGNLVERSSPEQVRFVSRSRVFKAGSKDERHIWNSRDSRYVKEKAEIVCTIEELTRPYLLRWGGLSDAFSKAVILSADWRLPPVCREAPGPASK